MQGAGPDGVVGGSPHHWEVVAAGTRAVASQEEDQSLDRHQEVLESPADHQEGQTDSAGEGTVRREGNSGEGEGPIAGCSHAEEGEAGCTGAGTEQVVGIEAARTARRFATTSCQY